MSDLDKLLGDSLKSVGDAYSPRDEVGARQEFFRRSSRRRRIRLVGAVAIAGAAVVAAVFVATLAPSLTQPEPSRLATAPPPGEVEITTIPVGDSPAAVAAQAGYVYVVNEADGTLMKIDGDTEGIVQTARVGSAPDDVVTADALVGDPGSDEFPVYVADPAEGKVVEVRGSDLEGTDPIWTFDPEVHLDLAVDPSTSTLWTLPRCGSPARYGAHSVRRELPRMPGCSVDITVADDGTLWVLTQAGDLQAIDPRTHQERARLQPFGTVDLVVPLADLDLVYGYGYLWLAHGDAGLVYRIDPNTGEVAAPVDVGDGSFGAVAAGEGAIWALSATGDVDAARLTRIDPATATAVATYEMPPGSGDVAVGDGAVWVTARPADVLVKIDLHPDASPSPSEGSEERVATPTRSGFDHESFVFVYSADGDLFAQLADGSEVQLTDTPQIEQHPTISPDGTTLVYEIASAGNQLLQQLHLDTGRSNGLYPGKWPAYGPHGEFAFVQPGAMERGRENLAVYLDGPNVGTPGTQFHGAPLDAGAFSLRHLAWSPDATRLYWEVTWEDGHDLYYADVQPEGPGTGLPPQIGATRAEPGGAKGSQYGRPVVRPDGVPVVVKACCTRSPEKGPEHDELGVVDLNAEPEDYDKVLDLDHLPLVYDVVKLGRAGRLTITDDGYASGSYLSYLLSDGERLLLVDERGEFARIAPERREFAGFAVMPRVLNAEPGSDL